MLPPEAVPGAFIIVFLSILIEESPRCTPDIQLERGTVSIIGLTVLVCLAMTLAFLR